MRSADEALTDDAAVRARAERTLLKRLRGRSLSVREARDVLREAELAEADADAVIAAFLDNGYLDDSRLAEQLLDGALGRKAQGATAIAQTLSRRGLDAVARATRAPGLPRVRRAGCSTSGALGARQLTDLTDHRRAFTCEGDDVGLFSGLASPATAAPSSRRVEAPTFARAW
ncbi:MAG: hypothetical protein K0S70_1628 [Microbacterium sp.]|nr:hypothetical protein [Microbacterium sp.]